MQKTASTNLEARLIEIWCRMCNNWRLVYQRSKNWDHHDHALCVVDHRRSQDFLWGGGCTFLLTKNLMTFFIVITLSNMVLYVMYCHQLPFYLICGSVHHQIQPHFCLIPTKVPRENFFRRPGGAPASHWLRLCCWRWCCIVYWGHWVLLNCLHDRSWLS